MTQRHDTAGRLLILLAWLSLLLTGAAGAEAVGPEAVVRDVAVRLSDAIESNGDAYREDPELLEALVREELLPALDVTYSARLILGRAGRGASPEQLDAFASTTSDILIERYASGLLEYRDREQVEVMPLRGELNEKMTRVRTRVRLLNGNHIPVDYVFRKTDEGWKAFDVIVEGISYVTTYRNQIKPRVEELGLNEVIRQLSDGSMVLADQ